MTAKVLSPTTNPFEILASATEDAEAKKKTAKKAIEEETGVRPTPAAKAQARLAKQQETAAKAKSEKDDFTSTQTKGATQKPLNRNEYFAQKRVDEEGFLIAGRPQRTREKNEKTSTNENKARTEAQRKETTKRETGSFASRGPLTEGGLNTSESNTPIEKRRNVGSAKQHGYRPPLHGRAFDRHSGMLTSRKQPIRKDGVGKGGLGTENDDLAAQIGLADPIPEADKDPIAEEPATETAGEAPEQAPEEEDNTKSLEAYLAEQARMAAELLAKIGRTEPRKLEDTEVLSKAAFHEPPKLTEFEQMKTSEKKSKSEGRKGEKTVSIAEIFDVHAPPIARGRGRGRGRGGRGSGEGAEQKRQGSEQGESGRGNRGGRGRGRGARGRGRQVVDTQSPHHFPDLGSE